MPATSGAGDHEIARAKVNLALHVVGTRADGYRLIETLVVFADFGDVLAAAAGAPRLELVVDGPFAGALEGAGGPDDNLAVRAGRALVAAVGKRHLAPLRLKLTKRLPVAAGLGGGSADAAAALRLLDRRWRLRLSPPRLAAIARGLGADVPMCLASRPLIARGVGERIRAVALPRLPMVLARPPVAVPTPAVFAALDARPRPGLPPLPASRAPDDLVRWLEQTRNDLGDAAATVARGAGAAARALARDRECLFARMSGSGAAAFGIFASGAAARRAAARLKAARPRWWVVPTVSGGSEARGSRGPFVQSGPPREVAR